MVPLLYRLAALSGRSKCGTLVEGGNYMGHTGQPLSSEIPTSPTRMARVVSRFFIGMRFAGNYWFALALFSSLCALTGGIIGSELGVYNLLRAPSTYSPNNLIAFLSTDGRFLTATYITCASAFIVVLANFNMGAEVAQSIEVQRLLGKLTTVARWMSLPLIFFLLTKISQRNPSLFSEPEDVIWTAAGIGLGLALSAILVAGWHLCIRHIHSKSSVLYFLIFLFSFNYLTTANVAAVAVLTMFGWIAFLYFLFGTLSRPHRGLLIIASVILLVIGGLEPHKHRLLNMGGDRLDLYAAPTALPDQACPATSTTAEAGLINPLSALSSWRSQFSSPPKLIIISASGGGYRATFWTGLVLDMLADTVTAEGAPALRNVRLLTGASGGMVALAYFAAMMTPDGRHTKSIVEELRSDIAKDHDRFIGLTKGTGRPATTRAHDVDSLSAITHALVHKDLPGLFWPFATTDDRGLALERQWATLTRSMESLSLGEEKGWRPSLILTPVIVERGAPLLISNLDLTSIASKDCRLAVEFFKLFPQSRSSFGLNTAVRINAAFPVISPTSKLPTHPPTRVADAGYYDNYGTDTATAFLQSAAIREWLVANTSGVIMVQIRAYPMDADATITNGPCGADHSSRGSGISAAFWRSVEWLTSPIEGLNSTRSAGNLHRAQRQLDLLRMIYPSRNHGGSFIEEIIFENRAQASLSWHLPARELNCMKNQLNESHNKASFLKLRDSVERDRAR
jgi:hypothetical protein